MHVSFIAFVQSTYLTRTKLFFLLYLPYIASVVWKLLRPVYHKTNKVLSDWSIHKRLIHVVRQHAACADLCICGYSVGRRKPGHGDDFHPGDSRPGKTQWNSWYDEKQTRRGAATEWERERGSREGRNRNNVRSASESFQNPSFFYTLYVIDLI